MKKPVYKRELSHSYLIMEDVSEAARSQYQYQMILKNRIPGLIPCSERFVEGKTSLYYDISSRQSLEQLYTSSDIGLNEIGGIIDNLTQTLDAMAEYLLEERCLILKPECIYMDLETEQLFFLYYPLREEEEGGKWQYLEIAEFFLEHVDHKEDMAVSAAYQFYKMSKAESFTVGSFRTILEKQMHGRKEGAGRGQGKPEERGPAQEWGTKPEGGAETEDVLRGIAGNAQGYGFLYGDESYSYGEAQKGLTLLRDTPESYEYRPGKTEEKGAQKQEKKWGKKQDKEPEKGQEKEREGEKKGRRRKAAAGLIITTAAFLLLCATIWYLKPAGGRRILLFAALAADGLCLLLFLWKIMTEKEGEEEEREEGGRESEETEGAVAFWEEYTPVIREELDGPTVYLREMQEDDGDLEGFSRPHPRLIGSPEGKQMEYSLERLPVMVGKLKSRAQLLLSDASVSRIHARFVEKKGKVALIDLNSTNGTFLNGVRLEQGETAILEKGDEILFGNVKMTYEE